MSVYKSWKGCEQFLLSISLKEEWKPFSTRGWNEWWCVPQQKESLNKYCTEDVVGQLVLFPNWEVPRTSTRAPRAWQLITSHSLHPAGHSFHFHIWFNILQESFYWSWWGGGPLLTFEAFISGTYSVNPSILNDSPNYAWRFHSLLREVIKRTQIFCDQADHKNWKIFLGSQNTVLSSF